MKDIFKESGIVLGVCLVFALMMTIFTPLPVSGLIHGLFASGGPASKPDNYHEVLNKISLTENLTYESSIKQNKFDLALPKEGSDFPVIIWVHGGAYVGGQKEDVRIYTNRLASEGFAVVNFEYDLAPRSRYPGPLNQLADLYAELKNIAPDYSLDLTNLVFAGDSAGGQIAAQFVNLQMDHEAPNPDLATFKVIPEQDIKAAVLFCAPLTFKNFVNGVPNVLIDFFGKRIAWAYTGDAKWRQSEVLVQADLLESVSVEFPPTFISDGNSNSFEEENKDFVAKLEAQKTPVTAVFYPISEAKLDHEYQLDFKLPQAEDTYQALVQFLNELD